MLDLPVQNKRNAFENVVRAEVIINSFSLLVNADC